MKKDSFLYTKQKNTDTIPMTEAAAVFEAVKQDDAEAFGILIDKKRSLLSLCYGRFPLLSLCYLYKSKKIIAAYGRLIAAAPGFTPAEEDYETYRLFRKLAGRCLRYYIYGKAVVSPAEMLAFLQDTYRLEAAYTYLPKNAKIIENIINIYRIRHGITAVCTDDKITVSSRPVSKPQRTFLAVSAAVALFIVILASAVWATYYSYFGTGSETYPLKISSEGQLKKAIHDDIDYCILTRDITLTENWESMDFKGSFNGNGHTIHAGSYLSDSFFSSFTGTAENVIFTAELEKEIKEDAAILASINGGTIKNVQIVVSGSFTDVSEQNEEGDETDVYLSLAVGENNGLISALKVTASVTFSGNGKGDVYLAAIASFNNSEISDCELTKESSLSTDSADVSGLVAENNRLGIVKDCVNKGNISQTSSNENWLPNAAGLVLKNLGEVSNCLNEGSVSVTTNVTGTARDAYAGGIVAINSNQIIQCKNTGEISVTTEAFNIYAGGISSYNAAGATIHNSCSYGALTLSTKNANGFVFGGGICGYTLGIIKSSYSYVQTSYDNGHVFLGGICGVAYYGSAAFQNNYYVKTSNIAYGNASYLWGNTVYAGDNIGAEELASESALKDKGVYWG